jgi:hypothetical protein
LDGSCTAWKGNLGHRKASHSEEKGDARELKKRGADLFWAKNDSNLLFMRDGEKWICLAYVAMDVEVPLLNQAPAGRQGLNDRGAHPFERAISQRGNPPAGAVRTSTRSARVMLDSGSRCPSVL